jgi:hypothetical protein
MTAQIPDTVEYDGRSYAIVGVDGSGLFDPRGGGFGRWRCTPPAGGATSATTASGAAISSSFT